MSCALPIGTSCTSSPCLANKPLRSASSKCAWSGRPATPTLTTVMPPLEGLAAAGADDDGGPLGATAPAPETALAEPADGTGDGAAAAAGLEAAPTEPAGADV